MQLEIITLPLAKGYAQPATFLLDSNNGLITRVAIAFAIASALSNATSFSLPPISLKVGRLVHSLTF